MFEFFCLNQFLNFYLVKIFQRINCFYETNPRLMFCLKFSSHSFSSFFSFSGKTFPSISLQYYLLLSNSLRGFLKFIILIRLFYFYSMAKFFLSKIQFHYELMNCLVLISGIKKLFYWFDSFWLVFLSSEQLNWMYGNTSNADMLEASSEFQSRFDWCCQWMFHEAPT